jgi:hypothetical protein
MGYELSGMVSQLIFFVEWVTSYLGWYHSLFFVLNGLQVIWSGITAYIFLLNAGFEPATPPTSNHSEQPILSILPHVNIY